MDTDSFLFHVKTEEIQEDTAKEVEKRFDTSNYELQRPLPKRKKTKKMIGLMKNDISGKKMEEFEVLRAKKCSYLTDDNDGSEKGKSTENM